MRVLIEFISYSKLYSYACDKLEFISYSKLYS